MEFLSEITTVVGCFVVSAVALFLVTRSFMASVPIRTVLLAAVLMTIANGIQTVDYYPLVLWIAVAIVDLIIVKKVFDGTPYFTILTVAMWEAIQIIFYKYLDVLLQDLLRTIQ